MASNIKRLKEEIGEKLFIGFHGTQAEDIKEMIKKYYIGGVIFFERNITNFVDLCNLIYDLQSYALKTSKGKPLLIGIDQEGGRVTRIGKPLTDFPSNRVLGKANSYRMSYLKGKIQGMELSRLGFNINFSPVLDIDSNPNNTVIGDRALGKEPELVKKLGCGLIRGLQRNGVISGAKHFPGHGDTDDDSHFKLPILNYTLEKLMHFEIIPFEAAIQAGVGALMPAHIAFPKIEANRLPATFSRKILTDLLRKKLNFHGVIISDDFEMKAVEDNISMDEAPILALRAGIDMIMVCHSKGKQIKAFENMVKALEKGKIGFSKILRSNKKIDDLKRKYFKGLKKPEYNSLGKIHKGEWYKNALREMTNLTGS